MIWSFFYAFHHLSAICCFYGVGWGRGGDPDPYGCSYVDAPRNLLGS